MPTYQSLGYAAPGAFTRDRTRAVFGQVMGLVALTVGCAALGAYITRNSTHGAGFLFFIGAFACIFGLNFATARRREQLAIGLLFGMGLLIGMAMGPLLAYYAHTQPAVLWQAAGATGAFIAAAGSFGYATRRDLSHWARGLFWALLGLILVGLVLLFVHIPHAHIVYAIGGLVIFGAFTIFDFNRLKRTSAAGAVPIAASIFLDILNVFQFMLMLFGGGNNRN
jgi:FtsH-binding integral membrane protein